MRLRRDRGGTAARSRDGRTGHRARNATRTHVAAHHEGGAAEAPRHRDRKVAIVLVGRECISEVHRSMNITHPPQRL